VRWSGRLAAGAMSASLGGAQASDINDNTKHPDDEDGSRHQDLQSEPQQLGHEGFHGSHVDVGGVMVETQNTSGLEASENMKNVSTILHDKFERCRKALSQAPLVAVLLSADAPDFNAAGEGSVSRTTRLEVEAELKYFDRPCKLWVVRPKEWPSSNGELPAEALIRLEKLFRTALNGHFAHDGTCIWPIQSFEHAVAIMEFEEILLAFDTGASWCHRLLYALRILRRRQHFIGVIRAHFGPDAAFNYSWSCHWVQHLWWLAVICFAVLCAGVTAPSGESGNGNSGRIPWEVSKGALCLWVMGLPLSSCLWIPKAFKDPFTSRSVFRWLVHGSEASQAASSEPGTESPSPVEILQLPPTPEVRTTPLSLPHQSQTFESLSQVMAVADIFCEDTEEPNPDYQAHETWQAFGRRCAQAFLCMFCIWVFFAFLRNFFMTFVWLIMYVIYLWGECDTVDPPCSSPDGPDDKYYPRGTLVEISCDIMLAILFEAFIPISMLLGNWLARLANHKTIEDLRFTAQAVTLVLAALERVSFLVILGMFFAPQWEAPDKQVLSDRFNMDDCFETAYIWALFKGDNAAFACIRSRLPYKDRLLVFTKLVKGPFMVAPFVGIIVKILVPLVVERLDFWSRRFTCLGRCEGFTDGLCRILSFIFVYDGEVVGGPRFIVKGWPFRDLRVVNRPASNESEVSVSEVAETLDVCDPVLMAARPFRCLRRSHRQQLFEIDSSGRRVPQPNSLSAPPSGEQGSLPSTPSSHQTSNPGSATNTSCDVDSGVEASIIGQRRAEEGQADLTSTVAGRHHDSPLSLETRLQLVIQQGARKPFEPRSELLSTKMNVIFVAFFVAVMPYGTIGAFVTLAAKLLELKCSLSKMVFVRRRAFAASDRAMRRTQRIFVFALAVSIPAWSASLSLITYNETLYKWGEESSDSKILLDAWSTEPRDIIIRLVLVWLALVAIIFVTANAPWWSWKRWLFIAISLPMLWFYISPTNTIGEHKSA